MVTSSFSCVRIELSKGPTKRFLLLIRMKHLLLSMGYDSPMDNLVKIGKKLSISAAIRPHNTQFPSLDSSGHTHVPIALFRFEEEHPSTTRIAYV
jgi:hypothetical protein